MYIRIDSTSSTPIYLQIIEQIKSRLLSGRLEAGERLPSIRELAVQLTINPGTVAKAYQELEKEGVVEIVKGTGVYVSQHSSEYADLEKSKFIIRRLAGTIAEAISFGMETSEMKSLLDEAIRDFEKRRAK